MTKAKNKCEVIHDSKAWEGSQSINRQILLKYSGVPFKVDIKYDPLNYNGIKVLRWDGSEFKVVIERMLIRECKVPSKLEYVGGTKDPDFLQNIVDETLEIVENLLEL